MSKTLHFYTTNPIANCWTSVLDSPRCIPETFFIFQDDALHELAVLFGHDLILWVSASGDLVTKGFQLSALLSDTTTYTKSTGTSKFISAAPLTSLDVGFGLQGFTFKVMASGQTVKTMPLPSWGHSQSLTQMPENETCHGIRHSTHNCNSLDLHTVRRSVSQSGLPGCLDW